MNCLYNAHLLGFVLKNNKDKLKTYMITNDGFAYLTEWIQKFRVANILL